MRSAFEVLQLEAPHSALTQAYFCPYGMGSGIPAASEARTQEAGNAMMFDTWCSVPHADLANMVSVAPVRGRQGTCGQPQSR